MKTRIESLSKHYESKILEANENIKLILNTSRLTANTSEELLKEPVVLETTDILKATMSSNDSTTVALSYLVIT